MANEYNHSDRKDGKPVEPTKTKSRNTAANPPFSAQPPGFVYTARRSFEVEFSGTASEYFRIWIVNLFLTVLTLGIYAAWAKVRTRRYFYAHTTLAGYAFDYRADPWFILRGNLIIGTGLLLYLAAEAIWPLYSGMVLIAYYGLFPFLVYKSLRFNAYNSAYRNIRFRFRGSIKECYKIYLLIPILIPLSLGLIVPYWVFRRKKYFFENFSFGQSSNIFSGTAGPFYQAYSSAGLILIAFSMISAVGAFVFLSQQKNLVLPFGKTQQLFMLLPVIGFLAASVIFTFIQQFLFARLTNYCWKHSGLEGLHFDCQLKANRLLLIRVTNAIGIILSLGLLIPWAKIRRARYVLSSLTMISERSLDEFTASEESAESAIGEVATGFFDIDIGL